MANFGPQTVIDQAELQEYRPVAPGGEEAPILPGERQAAREGRDQREFITDLLGNMSSFFQRGNGQGTQTNPHYQRGLNLTGNQYFAGAYLNAQTQKPLPFDEVLQNPAALSGLVGGLNPELYQVNEAIITGTEQMGPEMVRALQQMQSSGLYEGIPDEFQVKRLRILLYRKRENDIYAFI